MFSGPPRRAQAASAVPQAAAETGGVRLHHIGEHLEALDPAEVGGGLAAHQVQQPPHPLMAEVLRVGGVRVQGLLDLLVVHRRADAHPRVEPAPGEDVDGGQVLREAQRVLPAQRDDRGAELDAPGALRGGGEDGDGGGYAVLEVPVAHPGAVEAEPFPQLDDLQSGLVPPARIVRVEQPDGEEAQPAQRA